MAKVPKAPSLPSSGQDPRTGLNALNSTLYQILSEHAQAINYLHDRLGPVVLLPSYTVATLPVATSPGVIFVSDETGGATMAYADGTNWRRVYDNAVVS